MRALRGAILCAAWALLLWAGLGASLAQMNMTIVGDTHHPGGGGGFSGPCDASGASCTQGWWLGALTSSYATATGNDFDAKRTSDNTTCTVKVNTSGKVDQTGGTFCPGTLTFQAWATRSTFTGATISTTTLNYTGSSGSTPVAGDQLIGTGLSANTTITSCSGFGGAGTCVISPSQTEASSETMHGMIPIEPTQFYDQIGSNNQTPNASTYTLIWICTPTGEPCMFDAGSGNLWQAANTFTPATGVVSASLVIERSVFSSAGPDTVFTQNGGAHNGIIALNAANLWHQLGSGTSEGNVTINDGAIHAIQSVINGATAACSTAGTCINVDGTDIVPAGGTAGDTNAAKPSLLFDSNTIQWVGTVFSDNTGWGATTRTAVCHAENTWTGGSC